ncbi:MAG TPA: M61 family peptidase [Candidatus Eisenbacteria bacterium]|nr:M61 family peptidase [Candidatus Eisenbacteria bacterium]
MSRIRRLRNLARLLALGLLFPASPGLAQVAHLDVDLRESPRRLIHAHLVLPVKPGPLTLLYPKWIPGDHGPTGPIRDFVNLRLTAGGREVEWRRDDEEMFSFHVQVPAGASQLDLSFDLLPNVGGGEFDAGASVTPHLALLSWNQVVLYPQGVASDDMPIQASLRLPDGWKWATSLPVERSSGSSIDFERVSLTTLVDSPVLTGRYLKAFPLGTVDGITHELDIATDDPVRLEVPDSILVHYRRLVHEANALFGAHHYRRYHFLYTLSDNVDHFGLEHHESSDDRVPERSIVDHSLYVANADLLSHEMVHSWNGKYRRPADLATPDYEKPMHGSLLWVYEGLTEYLGWVLAARSGLFTTEQARGELARDVAVFSNRPGRDWRPLYDTAVAAQILYGSPTAWSSLRRGTDFYDEGTLLWLDVDTKIRQLTHGQRSLDDFCRAFHGPPSSPPQVVPYTREDVEHALGQIAPYDWKSFFAARVDSVTAQPPLGGVTASGWKMAYADSATEYYDAVEALNEEQDHRFSIGLRVATEDGKISDVLPGSPAAKAGLGPDMELVGINGRVWNEDRLKDAVKHTAQGEPLDLLIKNDEFFRDVKLDYKGGLRYPELQRIKGVTDVLSKILAPRTGTSPAAR